MSAVKVVQATQTPVHGRCLLCDIRWHAIRWHAIYWYRHRCLKNKGKTNTKVCFVWFLTTPCYPYNITKTFKLCLTVSPPQMTSSIRRIWIHLRRASRNAILYDTRNRPLISIWYQVRYLAPPIVLFKYSNDLRSYDTFRNLSLICLKFCIRKEHSTVILKTT